MKPRPTDKLGVRHDFSDNKMLRHKAAQLKRGVEDFEREWWSASRTRGYSLLRRRGRVGGRAEWSEVLQRKRGVSSKHDRDWQCVFVLGCSRGNVNFDREI